VDEIQAGDRLGDWEVVEVIENYWERGVHAVIFDGYIRGAAYDREWVLKEK
jgi:hypothetical protein